MNTTFAAKLLAGIGDETEWAARMGDAAWVQSLKDRVDLEFLPGNPEQIAPGQPVALRVAVKNVPELMLRVYAVDTVAWHRQHGEEVATDIELGGLVPNHEQVLKYDQAPLRRHEESLTIPAIQGRGVWVVELIGNGRASRAVLRVGDLTAEEQTSTAGQRFLIRDEAGQPLPAASIWLHGRRFEADEHGSVLLPFSTEPGQRLASIEHAGVARPLRFAHLGEQYQLEIGAHVDAEFEREHVADFHGIHGRLAVALPARAEQQHDDRVREHGDERDHQQRIEQPRDLQRPRVALRPEVVADRHRQP